MGLIRTLHAWAGAFLALLMIVFGVTGSLLVLEEDWLRLTVPEARARADVSPESLGRAAEAVERAFPRQVDTVAFAGGRLGIHKAYLADERFAYAAGDGRVVARWQGHDRAEEFIFGLHHDLLAGNTGLKVGGAAALAGAVLVLTGLVVWAPAWRSFAWRLWPRSGMRRDLIGSHRDLGVIFAIPIFVLCLTAGAIVFHQTAKAMLKAVVPGEGVVQEEPSAVGSGDIDWPRALAAAQARFPHAQIRMASWPGPPGTPATVRLKQPGEWHPNGRTVVMIDPATSDVVWTADAQQLAPSVRIANGLYPVHAAFVGGRLYDVVTFLSGLALAGLGGVGLWAFLVKPRRRARSGRPSPAA